MLRNMTRVGLLGCQLSFFFGIPFVVVFCKFSTRQAIYLIGSAEGRKGSIHT